MRLQPGEGDKLILRTLAHSLGLKRNAFLVKRAMQFGTRIANPKVPGQMRFPIARQKAPQTNLDGREFCERGDIEKKEAEIDLLDRKMGKGPQGRHRSARHRSLGDGMCQRAEAGSLRSLVNQQFLIKPKNDVRNKHKHSKGDFHKKKKAKKKKNKGGPHAHGKS